jgi:ubiquinone biosynthesis protein
MFENYKIKHRIEVFRRYRKIVEVLVKYGFGEMLGRMNLATHLRIGRRKLFKKTSDLAQRSYAERIRLALEELGPTFIKLGQVLSTRPFLIPVDLVIELAKLQDDVAPFDFMQVKEIIEKEFGRPIHVVFQSFEEKPVASASLSQVHIALLKDGKKVAVKVQRPGVRKIMDVDMEILHELAVLAEKYVPESIRFDPTGQIDELAKVSRRECDFMFEGRNMEIFGINFKDDNNIIIPEVMWEYTTKLVLVCEYIDGIKVSSIDQLKQAGIDLEKLAHNGLHIVMKMIFEDKFFHADPHPGNIFVKKDGRLALLDFGMVGQVPESIVDFFVELLFAASSRDARKIIRALLDFNLIPDDCDELVLESDITEILYRYHKIPLWQIDMKTLLADSMDIFFRHNIRMPGSFTILMKALITAEEVARMLDPKINMIEEIEPFIKKLAFRKMKFSVLKSDSLSFITDLRELFTTLPFDIKRITRKISKGEMEVRFRHRGLEDLTNEMFQSSKRVSLALIIAAILISSALLHTAHLGFTILGIPILSLLGYSLTGFLVSWLIINILRSGKGK